MRGAPLEVTAQLLATPALHRREFDAEERPLSRLVGAVPYDAAGQEGPLTGQAEDQLHSRTELGCADVRSQVEGDAAQCQVANLVDLEGVRAHDLDLGGLAWAGSEARVLAEFERLRFRDLEQPVQGVHAAPRCDVDPARGNRVQKYNSLLQQMGSAAVGLVTAHHYHSFLKSKANQDFVKAWKEAYGAKAYPGFLGIGGYDGMAAVYAAIKAANGGKLTADGAMKALKGWKSDSPRGPISIDAETRDIVQNVYVSVVREKDGMLKQEVLRKFDNVRDKCKELKLGKCGKKLY